MEWRTPGDPADFRREILEKGGRLADGNVFVPFDAVTGYLNKRFYWDSNENILLYTTPTERMIIAPEANSYMVGEESRSAEGIICKVIDGAPYVNIAFVKQMTDIEYTLLQQPDRLAVQYQWSDVPVVQVKEDTQVRYRGGIKSEILTEVEKGKTLRMLDDLDDWKCVVTDDGYVGYIKTSKLEGEPQTQSYEREFQAPQYTSITRDHPINLTWHQVTNTDANDMLDMMLEGVSGVNVISPPGFPS